MREFIRVMCVVVFIVAAPTAYLAWGLDEPGAKSPFMLYGCPALAVLAVAWFVYDSLRRDRAPDFLKEHFKTFFDANGLTFVFVPAADRGIEVYFQNRYARPCRATVALRPASGEYPSISPMHLDLECPGGAYGIAHRPLDERSDAVGRTVTFDVGATVRFPQGKGRILRFRDGITVRHNKNFRSYSAAIFKILGFLSGSFLQAFRSSRLPQVTLSFPNDYRKKVRAGEWTQILWKIGDPIP